MSRVDFDRPGDWRALWAQALRLTDHLERHVPDAHWTFGGGTALMLRIGHRFSKDIDLFVSDPQYLGFVTPRLSEVAEKVSTDYEESAEFVKLFLSAGEIDFVAGGPLTADPWEMVSFGDRGIRVETCAEIVAKKMWHRGDRAKARDLYDLCAVADAEPEAIRAAAPFFARHGAAFLAGLEERAEIGREEFARLDVIGPVRNFDKCLAQAGRLIGNTPSPDYS